MNLTEEAAQVLSTVPYFAELDSSTLKTIARAAVRREYEPGQVILLEGEPCAGLFVVQAGWCKAIMVSPEGREQIVRTVGPGEFFNEMPMLAGSKNLITVVALEPAVLWVVQTETMLRLLDEQPRVARLVTQSLARRMLHLLSLVEDLSLRSVEERLARLLLTEAVEDVVPRRRWSTQTELAARLGTVTDVLNRAMRSLVQDGLVEVDRQQVRIVDRAGLEASARPGG